MSAFIFFFSAASLTRMLPMLTSLLRIYGRSIDRITYCVLGLSAFEALTMLGLPSRAILSTIRLLKASFLWLRRISSNSNYLLGRGLCTLLERLDRSDRALGCLSPLPFAARMELSNLCELSPRADLLLRGR